MKEACPTCCGSAGPSVSSKSLVAPVLVLGVGNTLMRDDGIGVEVVAALACEFDIPKSVRIIDGGIAGFGWLPELAGADHLLIVDAVRKGNAPGSYDWLSVDDLVERRGLILSPHQVGVTDLLGIARLLGHLPRNSRILGVEPLATTPFGLELTDALRLALPQVVAELVQELGRLGVALSRKDATRPSHQGPHGFV